MKRGMAAIFTMLLMVPASRALAGGPIVAVFDMEDRTSTFDREVLDNLTEYLLVKLAEGDFQVIPRDQIRDRLVREKRGSHRECYDKSCQIDMGREMAAQKVLSARILKVAGRCQLAVTLYDLKKAATERAASAEGLCNEESMGAAVKKVAARLSGKVEVNSGKATEVKLTLESAPTYSRWGHITFWAGLGAAAFGAVSGVMASSVGDDYKAGDRSAYDSSVAWSGCMYAGLAAGGALIITGVVLWALAPSEDVPSGVTSISALPSPEGGLVFSVGGRF